jgi:hypothetical protein
VLGQTREGSEGGWKEGGEKSGRDEGVEGGGGGEEELEGGVWRRVRLVGCGGTSIEFSEREEWR